MAVYLSGSGEDITPLGVGLDAFMRFCFSKVVILGSGVISPIFAAVTELLAFL